MSKMTSWDSFDIDPKDLYIENRIQVLDKELKLTDMQNCYVDDTDALAPFPIIAASSTVSTGVSFRQMWMYKCYPYDSTIPYYYLIASFYDTATTNYLLFYKNFTTAGGWTALAGTSGAAGRSSTSRKLHKITFLKNKAYVLCFPDPASADKQATIILDGTSGTITQQNWGLPGPTTPARMQGANTIVANAGAKVTATQATITTTGVAGFPAAPFTIQIGREQMTVTAVGGVVFAVTRGINGTLAQEHDDKSIIVYRNWSASTYKVEVNQGWKYAYSYQSSTKQISNRSDIERDPANKLSDTLPFFDLIPRFDVQGVADTTNIPAIIIWRTTDGGGNFSYVKTIPNTGAGTIGVIDNTGPSSDPISDSKLDTANKAPSLTSNSPPPRVNAPFVSGTDTPSQATYSITTYASRIWYNVGRYVYYSAREEISEGILEECFPSGNRGNYYEFPDTVVGLAATDNGLYVVTTEGTYKTSDLSVDTFEFNKFSNIGGLTGDDIICVGQSRVYFFTSNLEVARLTGNNIEIISKPICLELSEGPYGIGQGVANAVQLVYHSDTINEYIILAINSVVMPTNLYSTGIYYFYDIKRSEEQNNHIWNGKLSLKSSCVLSAQKFDTTNAGGFNTQPAGIYFGNAHSVAAGPTFYAGLLVMNLVTFYGVDQQNFRQQINDAGAFVPVYTITVSITVKPVRNPSGNHVNLFNNPSRVTKLYGFLVYYKPNATPGISLSAPTVSVTLDNLSSSTTLSPEEPYLLDDTGNNGYTVSFYPLDIATNNPALTLSQTGLNSTNQASIPIYKVTAIFAPTIP